MVEYATFEQSNGAKPVIEIRTIVAAAKQGERPRMQQRQYDSDESDYDNRRDRVRYPGAAGYANRGNDDLKTFKAEKPEMVIHSPYLCAALSAVVGYYPGFTSVSEGTVIPSPYQVVVHHWAELEAYRDNQPSTHDAEYAATTAKHIDALFSFLRSTFSEQLAAEHLRWDSPSGSTATFDLLWLLLKPGEVVYREKNGYLSAYIVSSVLRDEQTKGQDAYLVNYWNVAYLNGRLTRSMHTSTLHAWNGERDISSLQLIPARFVKGGEQAMAEKRTELGKLYWSLAGQPSYREYDGPMKDKEGKRQGRLTGRVIVDCEGWERFREGPLTYDIRGYPLRPMPPHQQQGPPPRLDVLPATKPRCPCKACGIEQRPLVPGPFAGFDDLDPNQSDLPGNARLYFQVLSDTIHAFVLGQRSWGMFFSLLLSFSFTTHKVTDVVHASASIKVEHLSEVRPDQDAFKYLVLDPEIKLTVKALIGKFANSDGKVCPWPSDFVKHKGEGRIFLLHGSPGVGKTCTAECIAELTRRPLLSVTSGDIGTTPAANTVERSLNYFLTLGERYGALVLLDEADVYLEARTTRDLPRNGLVSMFLRALEYYKGVLFLTTNRVEAFDDAFTSRIHVALHYRRLGDDDRARIWVHNFERLERDSASRCLVPAATRKYILDSEEVRALRLNGREIRNMLQTAVALAETDALEGGVSLVTVGEKHLRAVTKMSGGFKAFLRNKRAGMGDGDGDDDEHGDNEVAGRRRRKGRQGRYAYGYAGADDDDEDPNAELLAELHF